MNERGAKFSLVLCTVGRRDEVAAFCESLLRQNRDDCELILVDQNPDSRLDAIADAYVAKFPLRHIKSNTRGLSRARNVGLKYADGDLIGFPDDDCEYFDGYLDRVAELFDADTTLGGLTGYPTPVATRTLGDDWNADTMTLGRFGVLNRCQEFTIFVRRTAMKGVRFNEQLGVGAGTLWGADEGPDFLMRVVDGGARIVFYPRLYVYHPEKQSNLTPAIITRAASYARGRGALFRIHRFPLVTAANAVFRSVGGVAVYLLKCQPQRSKYYAAVCGGLLRGLFMRTGELAALKNVEDPAAVTEDGPVVAKAGAHA